jgi:hypothetical protein
MSDSTEERDEIFQDCERKNACITRFCDDRTTVERSDFAMAWIYIHTKQFDKAREMIERLPSLESNNLRESIMTKLIKFQYGFEQAKDNISANIRKLLYATTKEFFYSFEDLSWHAESEEALSVISCEEHQELARKVADESVTLVKDTQNLLPISPEKYKKVRLYLLEDRVGGGFKDGEGAIGTVKSKLEAEGFEVSLYDYTKPDFFEMFEGGVEDIKSKFDLAIYVACIDTASNQSVRRIDWVHLMAADAPWFVNDVPALFVSLANPYHLVDAPMIKTFINAYTPTETVVDQVIDKIMGRSEFKGINPVDPFCDIWGARF